MPLETPPAAPAAAAVIVPTPVLAPVGETPTPTAPVQATPPAALHDPNVIPLPKATYDELLGYKATVAKLEADRASAEAARKESEVQAQLQKGQFQEVMAEFKKTTESAAATERASRAAIEDRAKKYALSSEVAKALSRPDLGDGAPAQLMELFKNEFIVEPVGDSYAVRTQGFQTPSDFISAKLALPEYQRFLRPTTLGGVGVNHGGAATVPTPSALPPAPAPAPKNMGEAILLQVQDMNANKGLGDGRLNSAFGFGLKAAAR